MICDHNIALTVLCSMRGYPKPVRRVPSKDPDTGKKPAFIKNSLDLEPLTVWRLYRMRWKVGLLFKWIEQHLRIKALFGTSENAEESDLDRRVHVPARGDGMKSAEAGGVDA